ncbi:cupredoxin domain-containing protein [Halobacillus sp. B23F22_1]|uniref:cupredoxin domain-containing protein n=1 Tax=Halobacillus sp. B23F22_1 TaxID=3459514 RepID=UPI00373DF9A5
MKALVLSGKKIMWICSGCVLFAALLFVFNSFGGSIPTFSGEDAEEEVRTVNLVTGEFKAETADGEEIETYRWDPGTIFAEKGEPFKLSIYGVNGEEHPFVIEGTDQEGIVHKGNETVVDLQFDKKGVYRMICTTHADFETDGPMVAYIVVGD